MISVVFGSQVFASLLVFADVHCMSADSSLKWSILCQVAPHQSGSLVYKIDPLAPAHGVLKENDVVMQIDGVPIADDGTVEFRNEERVEFSHIVRAKHIGERACPLLACHCMH